MKTELLTAECLDLITARAQVAQLLLEFYRRAVAERKFRQATKFLRARIRLLRGLREKRGYES